jgi:prevent-host-death family protein
MGKIIIPIRELYARTGHYIRKAAAQGRFLVTHRGQPMAELLPLSGEEARSEGATWKDREILPAFAALMNEPVGGTESSLAVAEDRERG